MGLGRRAFEVNMVAKGPIFRIYKESQKLNSGEI